MADVHFDEDSTGGTYSATTSVSTAQGIPGLLVRWGFAKDAKSANLLLIIIAVVGIAASVFLFYGTLVPQNTVTPEQQRQMEWMKQGNVGPAPASFVVPPSPE